MFKLFLIVLILVGGFTLVARFFPQFLGMTLLHAGGFVLTGGIALILCLVYLGFKFVH